MADNALIGLESLYYVHHKSLSNPLIVKLDLSKAFDQVDGILYHIF